MASINLCFQVSHLALASALTDPVHFGDFLNQWVREWNEKPGQSYIQFCNEMASVIDDEASKFLCEIASSIMARRRILNGEVLTNPATIRKEGE